MQRPELLPLYSLPPLLRVMLEADANGPWSNGTSVVKATGWRSLRALHLLIQVHPHSAVTQMAGDHTSAVKLALESSRLPTIHTIFSACPALIRTADADGAYPIHDTARLSRTVSCLEYIIALWPEGVNALDRRGNTPLHWACTKRRGEDLTIPLLRAAPKTMRVYNRQGFYPVHIAARDDCVAAFTSIFNNWRRGGDESAEDGGGDAVTATTKGGGRTALEVAARHHVVGVVGVLDYIMCHYPRWWTVQNATGYTVIHVAASVGSTKLMDLLLSPFVNTDPNSFDHVVLSQRSGGGVHGDTPVHTAIRYRKLCVLQRLLLVFPQAVMVENHEHHTPFDIALYSDELRILLRACAQDVRWRCPVSSDAEWASKTVQRRTKIEALKVLVNQPSAMSTARKAALEVLRLPWTSGGVMVTFRMTNQMMKDLIHDVQDVPPGSREWHLLRAAKRHCV